MKIVVKKNLIFGIVLALATFLQPSLEASRTLVDKIVARVNDVNICRSDVNERQMQLGGAARSIEQCVQDELMFQKAKSYSAIMSETDLDKRMVALREGYGFGYQSQGDFEAFLCKEGLSIKRLREQVKRSGSVAGIENALVPKNALVHREDVAAYCLKHPEDKDESYLLSFATFSAEDLTSSGDLSDELRPIWTELDGWISKSALGSCMKVVADMKVGEVSKPAVKDSTCFMYRLENKTEKRPLSVDERYAEVEKVLLGVRKAEKEVEVKQRMRDEAAIVFFASK